MCVTTGRPDGSFYMMRHWCTVRRKTRFVDVVVEKVFGKVIDKENAKEINVD